MARYIPILATAVTPSSYIGSRLSRSPLLGHMCGDRTKSHICSGHRLANCGELRNRRVAAQDGTIELLDKRNHTLRDQRRPYNIVRFGLVLRGFGETRNPAAGSYMPRGSTADVQ